MNLFHLCVSPAEETQAGCDATADDCGRSEKRLLETIAPLVRSVEESPEPITTHVEGTVPAWIHGNFLRNGPGKFEFGNTQ